MILARELILELIDHWVGEYVRSIDDEEWSAFAMARVQFYKSLL